MPQPLLHGLKFEQSRDSVARQDFVVGLRRYVLNDLADALRRRFDDQVAPAFEREHGRSFATQDEIHAAMLGNTTFQFYSAARYNAQEMSWRSVLPEIAEHLPEVRSTFQTLARSPRGSLKLDPTLALPENVADLDVHLMPGGYESKDEILSGMVYDNGLTVFTAGFLGPHIDDIGQSMAHYIRERFSKFTPEKIVDCGCTIGHNTVPWAQVYPRAEVHGIDVAASSIRYGHARAESLAVPVHFHQMDATEMRFEDDSMDLVFSSQFLHELSLKDTRKFMAEAWRVLRAGGLLLTMELPPNRSLGPYDQFYLDWDCYYNREPFYRAFRDADATKLAESAGFDGGRYFEFTVPQYWRTSPEEFRRQIAGPAAFDDDTGRLSDGIRYFGFGFWEMSNSPSEASLEALGLLQRLPGKRPSFFPQAGVDQLFTVVIELAAELWVLRERVYAIEDVAGKAGIPLHDLVEKWSPSERQASELAQRRHAMMQQLFRTIDTGRVPDSDAGESADPLPPGSTRSR